MAEGKTLLLIDAHSILHRAYHALPPLTSPDGKSSQALYGLTSMLWKLFRENKPDYAAACFDLPEPTFRHKKFSGYKAQRPKTPDDLAEQLSSAPEVFHAFDIKTFSLSGYEGDDIIATLASRFKHNRDIRIVILTGDLDTLQLVEKDHLVIQTFRKGLSDTFIYNEKAVLDRYGLEPAQMLDYKALVGDPSDNVPGVSGVGQKTAAEWLKKFGNLAGVLKAAKEDGKIAKKITGHEKEAENAKSLVTLCRDVPVGPKKLEDLEIKTDPSNQVRNLCNRFGFESLLRRMADGENAISKKSTIRKPKEKPVAETRIKAVGAQASIFTQITQPPKNLYAIKPDPDVVWVDSESDLNPEKCQSSKTKTGFNLKDSYKRCKSKGLELKPPYFDLGVAFWLIDPDYKKYNEENLAARFLKYPPESGKEGVISDLYHFAKAKLDQYGMSDLMLKTEMRLLPILAEMEETGVLVDESILKSLAGKIKDKISKTESKIYEMAGIEFNLNSPGQLSEILYKRLGIPSKSTTKSFPSTKAEYLEAIKNKHPIVPMILEYRSDFKTLSTYVEPLSLKTDSNGRIHTEYVQTGTATGRLSAREPNLQNIPHDTQWARELRSAFTAPEGYGLVSLDYSQLELRIMASVSGDPELLKAFRDGIDVHAWTAAKIYKKDVSAVTPSERRVAKTLNFGLAYGMGSTAFAAQSGLPRTEAAAFIKEYKFKFPGVSEWQQTTIRDMREKGYTETITGRRRYFPELLSGESRLMAEAERAAINHPIQGLEGDIIKQAMIAVKEKLLNKGWWGEDVRMILSIHDELLFEVKGSMIKRAVPEISDAMEKAMELPGVSLRVDPKVGPNWNDLRAWVG